MPELGDGSMCPVRCWVCLANRTYKGLVTQASYRIGTAWLLGANYTLSWLRGNFTGENTGSGPIRFGGNDQPEYRQESWNFPTGYDSGDQRHKLRAWAQYKLPVSASAAGTSASFSASTRPTGRAPTARSIRARS
jgi:hypothetical protein